MIDVKNAIDCPEVWKPLLKGRRIGVLTHAPAVTACYERSLDLLCRELNVALAWGPEHGLDGVAQASDSVDSSRDARTGVTVHSLYGSCTAPTEEDLTSVDAVVCDFADIGSRMYTYIYTMSDTMKACAQAKVPFYVLDRANPIGGVRTEGILLKKQFASFVGRFSIPVRHGMTIGELARLFNEEFGIGCELTVIPVSGWRREMEFEAFGRCWVNPSPNMPSADCARIYNGTCLLEGTNVSEGRGTTRPYEIIGAPFIDAYQLADRLNRCSLRGLVARPCHFMPTFSKYANLPCHGIQWIITDRQNAAFYDAGIRLVDILRSDYAEFEFANADHFDHLLGSDEFRLKKITADALIERAADESRAFQKASRAYLLH